MGTLKHLMKLFLMSILNICLFGEQISFIYHKISPFSVLLIDVWFYCLFDQLMLCLNKMIHMVYLYNTATRLAFKKA